MICFSCGHGQLHKQQAKKNCTLWWVSSSSCDPGMPNLGNYSSSPNPELFPLRIQMIAKALQIHLCLPWWQIKSHLWFCFASQHICTVHYEDKRCLQCLSNNPSAQHQSHHLSWLWGGEEGSQQLPLAPDTLDSQPPPANALPKSQSRSTQNQLLQCCSSVIFHEHPVQKIIVAQRRAKPSRAEPSRAEPSRAEPSRAEPSRAEPSRAETPSTELCSSLTCTLSWLTAQWMWEGGSWPLTYTQHDIRCNEGSFSM